MTLKEKLDNRIALLSMESFGWTKPIYIAYSHLVIEKLDAAKTLTFSMALLRFFLWIAENLFTKEGKLTMPIWKWPSIIIALGNFLKSI